MKVSELEGALLDYWVAKALQKQRNRHDLDVSDASLREITVDWHPGVVETCFDPSASWEHGGPIIEAHLICTRRNRFGHDQWIAWIEGSGQEHEDQKQLVAAMRCLVASQFGDEVADI